MTYDETLAWIHQMEQFGIHLGLERMEELLNRMGRPERSLKIVHVAGTNGKGSVCTMIASILEAAGYFVGRYISPTLFEYRERIQINGKLIEEDALAQGMSEAREICEAMASDGLEVPTIFEIETAVAFRYFERRSCDFVVLEVGMGGRLDSTNVIESPILSVITSISMDHQLQLGTTVEAIAYEKAGIIKEHIPVAVHSQSKEVFDVISQVCKEKHSALYRSDLNQCAVTKRTLIETEVSCDAVQIFDYKQYKACQIHLAGTYQVDNACLAIEAVEVLMAMKDSGIHILPEHMYKGLSEARWPGRFECLAKVPRVFIDGAHNPEGAKRLRDSIRTYFPQAKVTLIMGVFKDKDYDQILKIMSEVSDTMITFTPEHSRGLNSDVLAEHARYYFSNVKDAKTAADAYDFAAAQSREDEVIVILGSLSTIAGFYDILRHRI